jgi:ABC-2 type transport system ATP-binding protein
VAAIELRDVRRTYRSSKGLFAQGTVVREALRGITLDVNDGELFGLLGPNGAGKTTLVKILATVLLPSSGSVQIFGTDIVRHPNGVRPRIGLVFGGERGLYGSLSGRDTLRFWGELYRVAPASLQRRVQDVLALVGLTDRADERVETYSRGMKQRLHLARGILHEPRLLLLDEPTIGLDPVASNEIRQLVRTLSASGITILLTTHYMAEAETLCHRVGFINDGAMLVVSAPQALTRASAERVVVEVIVELNRVTALRADLVRIYDLTVRDLAQSDGAITLRVEAPRSQLSALMREIAAHEPRGLATIEPTLEDVYLHLMGDRGMRV